MEGAPSHGTATAVLTLSKCPQKSRSVASSENFSSLFYRTLLHSFLSDAFLPRWRGWLPPILRTTYSCPGGRKTGGAGLHSRLARAPRKSLQPVFASSNEYSVTASRSRYGEKQYLRKISDSQQSSNARRIPGACVLFFRPSRVSRQLMGIPLTGLFYYAHPVSGLVNKEAFLTSG